MWRYRAFFPILKSANVITLGEGGTAVLEFRPRLFLKLEQLNPTGSYKDRFASCAVSRMKEEGKTRCLATSSGNTGAALAAYCARAGIDCSVFLVESTPEGKALPMLAHGATLRQVKGFGLLPEVTARVMEALEEEAQASNAALQISAFRYSPAGMAGVKTIAYELADELGEIDHVFVPVGGGGLLTALFRGFVEYRDAGRLTGLPRIHAVQPAGCATVAGPLERGDTHPTPVECTSAISGLQVPNLIDAVPAIEAVLETGGSGQMLSDEAIYGAQRALAAEGVFCEPAGAAAFAGYLQALDRKQIHAEQRTVCLVTGHGFKDPNSVRRMALGRTVETCRPEDLLSHHVVLSRPG